MKLIDLFDGLQKGIIDYEGGFIITSFFDTKSNYVHFETIHYESVKNIYVEDDGCIFQTDGKKLFVLFEPKSYIHKHIEPTFRADEERIPYRFNELDILTTLNQDKIMIGKEPIMSHNSFTISKPSQANFSFYFYINENTNANILEFFESVFKKDLRIHGTVIKSVLDCIGKSLDNLKGFT